MRHSTSYVIAFSLVAAVAACSSHRERFVTTEERTVAVRQPVAPPKMVDITIINLHGEQAADPTQEKVVGTIVNSGDRKVSGISIRVNALDRAGNVIRTVTTPPLAHEIAPLGGKAEFEALMPQDDAVAGYHAVAIAR